MVYGRGILHDTSHVDIGKLLFTYLSMYAILSDCDVHGQERARTFG
jgi:hypothetical protein